MSTKYSGFILAMLLVFICLWINVVRYPSVWLMIQGDYVPQTSIRQEEAPVDVRQDNDQLIVTSDSSGNFLPVSYDGPAQGSGAPRQAPIPAVPNRTGGNGGKTGTPNSTGQQKQVRVEEVGNDTEDRTGDILSDKVFREATLSKSVPPQERTGKPASLPTSKDQNRNNSQTGDDPVKKTSGHSVVSDDRRGYVCVKVPDHAAQERTQQSGITGYPGSSLSPYPIAGSPGTSLSLDSPSYSPVAM